MLFGMVNGVIVAGNLRKKLSITRHDGFGLKIKLDHVVVIVSQIRAIKIGKSKYL